MSEIPVESEQDAIAALERLGSGIIGRSPESNKGDGGSRKSVIFSYAPESDIKTFFETIPDWHFSRRLRASVAPTNGT